MNVVSNASPLINLAWINKLELLPNLFGPIEIPSAVWQEVVEKGVDKPGSKEIENAQWINVINVGNHDLVRSFRQELDAG